MKEVRRRFDAVEVDRLRVKPHGQDHRRVLPADRRGRSQLQHPPLAGSGRRRGLSGGDRHLVRLPDAPRRRRISRTTSASTAARASSSAAIQAAQAAAALDLRPRMRRALGDVPHELPDQYELRALATPYYHSRLNGGEGDMLVGKALWAHHQKKAHMICELSPYSCMPNTMSIGAMAAVIGKHPDLLYAPLEIKGDAEVHALSRCQMILTEAKKRAQREYDEVLERIGISRRRAGASADRRRRCGRPPTACRVTASPRARRPTSRCISPTGVADADRRARRRLDHGQGRRCARTARSAGRTTSATTPSRPRWCSSSSARMEAECGLTPERDRIFLTGSGAGLLAPLVGGKMVQEVVAVSAAVEKLHPEVQLRLRDRRRGHEDAVLHARAATARASRSTCSRRAAAAPAPSSRRPRASCRSAPSSLAQAWATTATTCTRSARSAASSPRPTPTRWSSRACRSRRSSPASTRRWSTRTSRRSPRATRRCPRCCCSAARTCSSRACRRPGAITSSKLWKERKIDAGPGASAIQVPKEALYYACLGCIEIAAGEAPSGRPLRRARKAASGGSSRASGRRRRRKARSGLVRDAADLERFTRDYAKRTRRSVLPASVDAGAIRCSSAATSAARRPRPWCSRPENELLFSCYAPSNGNPIEDAKALFRAAARPRASSRSARSRSPATARTCCKDIVGADVGIVETVAHATAALHYFPDADVICDVGGCDVKIMILRQGTVADFRLNSQCSSGNGAFLQGVAERYDVPLEQYAEQRVSARRRCRRWPWAAACSCSRTSSTSSARAGRPRRSWPRSRRCCRSTCGSTPDSCRTCAAAGRKFVLQGGTHRNLAVVKAQVDFIRAKVPDAEIVVHPYSGRGGRHRRGAVRRRLAEVRRGDAASAATT